ncbi:MAG TPA: hypothetical protein VG963_24520 [Polyangiaceae bacterium]|nr:hypothetical protein [Polyangiaceae bacterium]
MAHLLVLLALPALLACGGASTDAARGSLMRIEGAQYVPGATPAPASGPDVAAINLLSNTIWPGYADKPLRGALAESATAAAVALSGDLGYWIIVAGVPDVSAPGLPTFGANAAFSTTLAPGNYTLEVSAVDAAGHFGAPRQQTLMALAQAPSQLGQGTLVVNLDWDTEADLDLHVVDPAGDELFHGAPRLQQASGGSGTSSGAAPATLSADSNANCSIDGLRHEDVSWQGEPATGHYVVRVDAASLCGQVGAHWQVNATLDGISLGSARGYALDGDTRGGHDRGAGLLALEFDLR